jgi:hypothetical protein
MWRETQSKKLMGAKKGKTLVFWQHLMRREILEFIFLEKS